MNVTVSDLTGPGTIAKSNISLFRAHYIPVTTPTAWRDWNSPNPPGDWPDALVPSAVPGGIYQSFPFSVAAGKNQPVWVEVYVPKGSPAGTYNGTITVTATGKSPIAVPLTLTVWGFTLPDKPVLASDFWGYDLWMSEACQAISGETCSTLRENILTDLRRHRVGAGVTGTAPFPNATVDSILARQARIQVQSMSDANVQQLVAAYGSKQLYMYANDEPQTQAEIDAVNDPSGTVQRYRRNGVPALITVSWSQEGATHDIGWDANVDIFVPVHFALTDFTKAQQKLNAGKDVWSYTTGLGPNSVPSWSLDFDLINERIVPWLDYSKGLTGFLFWTPVYWCPTDPWANRPRSGASCSDGSSNNNGVVFYYPGDVVGAPNAAIPAARLKAIRDGVEDYDYLTLLARVDAAKAKSLAQNLAPAFDNWNHGPAALLAAREQVAAAILGVVSGGDGGVDGGVDGGGEGGSGNLRGDGGDGDAASSPGAADADDAAERQAPFVACSCRMVSAGRGRPALALVGFLLVLAVGRRRRGARAWRGAPRSTPRGVGTQGHGDRGRRTEASCDPAAGDGDRADR